MKRLVCGKLWWLSMACLWVLVAAQVAAPAPSAGPPPYEGCCPRDLVSTVWGFILTFVALTLDDWGSFKNQGADYVVKAFIVMIAGALNPIIGLANRLDASRKSWKLRRGLSTPEARAYIRTLSACPVVVNLSPSAYQDFHELRGFRKDEVKAEDFSDAFVVGKEVKDREQNNVQLTARGKQILVDAGMLPPVERLKLLQGGSGLAVAVSGAQGVGYLYGVLVRVVQGRHVSPVEAVGFFLSTLILVRAILHYFASSCHRPLLVFLDDEEEKEFVKKCQGSIPLPKMTKLAISVFCGGVCILPCGVLVFIVMYSVKTISLAVTKPLILLLTATVFSSTFFLTFYHYMKEIIGERYHMIYFILTVISSIIHAIVYVYSLVLTWKYWKSLEYNVPTTGCLSKMLPYIG